VGVVIEEDGKTEEEFVEELLSMNQELGSLNKEARKLEKIIHHNVLKLTGEE
jgi:type I restriction enzyme M protein